MEKYDDVTLDDLSYPIVQLEKELLFICSLLEDGEIEMAIKLLRKITRG